MQTIAERIMLIIDHYGCSKSEFARRINVTPAYISKLSKNIDSVPSDRTILDICREFNISETWIRTGDGEMIIRPDPDDEIDRILAQISASDDELIRRIIRAYWRLDQKEKAAISKLIDGLCENRNTPGE